MAGNPTKLKATAVQHRIEGALARSTLNPRQAQFMRLYADPSSATFGNAYRSAIAAGYAETTADNLTSLLWDKVGSKFSDILDAAGVTDQALAEAHKALLTCGEVAGVHAGVRLGYQVRRYLPTASSRAEELLKEIGADAAEAKRSVELMKRVPRDPHEIAAVCRKFLAWYEGPNGPGRDAPAGARTEEQP